MTCNDSVKNRAVGYFWAINRAAGASIHCGRHAIFAMREVLIDKLVQARFRAPELEMPGAYWPFIRADGALARKPRWAKEFGRIREASSRKYCAET